MYRLALAIAGDEADAADITQDAFVAVWRQLPKLRDTDRFDAWLHRIVINTARMATRGRRRRQVREIASEEAIAASTAPVRTDAHELVLALRQLNPDHRALLALHHLDGRPISEIAEILGIPAGTVKSRLFTARRLLEAKLAQDEMP